MPSPVAISVNGKRVSAEVDARKLLVEFLREDLRHWESQERPLTDHTQDISSGYASTRAGSTGSSKWDAAALRAALHIPTGTTEPAL